MKLGKVLAVTPPSWPQVLYQLTIELDDGDGSIMLQRFIEEERIDDAGGLEAVAAGMRVEYADGVVRLLYERKRVEVCGSFCWGETIDGARCELAPGHAGWHRHGGHSNQVLREWDDEGMRGNRDVPRFRENPPL